MSPEIDAPHDRPVLATGELSQDGVDRVKRRARSGVAWTSAEGLGGNAITFVFFIVMVRLLTPEVFGLMAAAAVFLALSDILMEQGLGKAIIQREELRPEHLDTAFWTQIALSAVVCIVGIAAAPWVAALYQLPELTPVLRVIIVATPLAALSAVQEAVLLRAFKFKKLVMRRLIANFAGGLVGVVFAAAGYGVWSLVAVRLVELLAGVLLLWNASAWRPGRAVEWAALSDLMHFSLHLFFQRGLAIVKRRADPLLIGVYLGATALGFYAMAFRVVTIVVELFVRTFSKVSLPWFSRLQSTHDALRGAYATSVFAAAVFSLPAAAGLIVTAPELVQIVFGAKWLQVVPVLQVLALQVCNRSLDTPNTAVILAKGHSRFRLMVAAAQVPLSFLFIWLVIDRGILVVAAVNVAFTFAMIPVNAWMVRRLIHVTLWGYLRALAPPFAAVAAMLAVAVPLRVRLIPWVPSEGVFAVTVVAAVFTYCGALWFISAEFRVLVRETWEWMVSNVRHKAAFARAHSVSA